MRFELILTVNPAKRGSVLPLNYQYELSSWIYKVLNEGDARFASWLHDHGYKAYNRPFKLFTFSNLIIPEYRIHDGLIEIISKEISLILSFLPDEAISPFINGLFKGKDFIIGNKSNQVALEISRVNSIPEIEFKERMIFQTISPIFLSTKDQNSDKQTHLSPTSQGYSDLIHQNLVEKSKTTPNLLQIKEFPRTQIKLLNTPKSKLITLKSGSNQMSKIRAFNYTFEITGHPDLISIGYYAGFGRLGSQGFGCVILQ